MNRATQHLSIFLLTLLGATSTLAQNQTPLRVVCLGDSITFGARVDAATQSYPAQLQKILGPTYRINNLGLGSATLIKPGKPNVWKKLPDALAFNPHIVVISLGTNDTVSGKRPNWEKIARFDSDFTDLVNQLAALPTQPHIILCTPTPMVLQTPGLSDARLAQLAERKPRLQELCRRIRKLVPTLAAQNVTLLELNTLLENKPDLIHKTDGVHPNAEGYLTIAKAVASHIRNLKTN